MATAFSFTHTVDSTKCLLSPKLTFLISRWQFVHYYVCLPKMSFKYFKCWADWSIKGVSEVTPPTPNSSQSNFSSNEKSESRGKMLETSEMISHHGTRTLWRVHEARKWQMFTAGPTGVWKVSQPEAEAQPEWDTGWREHWAHTGCSSSEKRLIFNSYVKDYANAAAQMLPTAPLHLLKWKPALWVSVFQYFHKELLHLTISQQCSEWDPAPDPWFQQIFPINGIHGSLSQQALNNNQGKQHKCCNKYLVLYINSHVHYPGLTGDKLNMLQYSQKLLFGKG